MKITTEQKNEIRALLALYVERYPSQNKAANSLVGVSAGTLSTILNGKYEMISDDMWVKLRAQISSRKAEDWALCSTNVYKELSLLLDDAQCYQNVAWAISPAGSGKTTTVNDYTATHDNAYLVCCSEDMHRGDFIRDLARAVGVDVSDMSLRAALEHITGHLLTLDNPLLIFDEADKLADTIFYYFITIYNRLEGHCGIIFQSTHYIKRRMDIGLSYNKKGYDEIHSRICRTFISLTPASAYEVEAIARANGLINETQIREVVKDAATCHNDLRRVCRAIHKQKLLAALGA
ncbi:MAG: ATP-binding protein [Alistipes sp.]